MRLEKASYKAVKYACMNFHYAKSIPVNTFAYSVFNDKKEWCGCIVYGLGANRNLPSLFGQVQGQVAELVRMALNGKQSSTSKTLSLSIRLFKKDNPLIRLLISYADRNQGHFGTIYQASNWIYSGDSMATRTPLINGRRVHQKSIHSKYGTNSIVKLIDMGINVCYVEDEPKHRYIYPLDRKLIPMCKEMSKPYPKKTSA